MQSMIQDAPLGVFIAMVLFPLAMAGVAVFAGLHARRQARLVRTTKAMPIGMAEDGYRTFEGTAEAIGGQALVSPLTGSSCVWFSARVDEFKRSATTSNRKSDWVTVREITSSAPLLVRDSTGACVVRTLDAEVTPRDKSRWYGSTIDPEDRNPPRLGPQENLTPMVEVAGGANHRFRYTEMRIYPGDPLTVAGVFASHRFDARDDDGDDGEDEGSTDEAADPAATSREGAAGLTWQQADSERADALDALALSVTRAEIGAGGRGQPLILAATSAATHAYMSEMGAQAAFMVALVPLGIAALVLLARWG